jgi:effector-binding domain-containing protein
MNKFHFVMVLTIIMAIPSVCSALNLPRPEAFTIKQVDSQNILYVHHKISDGHITNSLIKLVQYYLLKENDHYEVVFPQLSIERADIQGSYIAIGYSGNPVESDIVNTTKLQGGLMASYIYKGSYTKISNAIRAVFRKVVNTGEYIPAGNGEIRLLYWNSIDDNQPEDLITEIQVRVKKLGASR